jgi:hypothetical protein
MEPTLTLPLQKGWSASARAAALAARKAKSKSKPQAPTKPAKVTSQEPPNHPGPPTQTTNPLNPHGLTAVFETHAEGYGPSESYRKKPTPSMFKAHEARLKAHYEAIPQEHRDFVEGTAILRKITLGEPVMVTSGEGKGTRGAGHYDPRIGQIVMGYQDLGEEEGGNRKAEHVLNHEFGHAMDHTINAVASREIGRTRADYAKTHPGWRAPPVDQTVADFASAHYIDPKTGQNLEQIFRKESIGFERRALMSREKGMIAKVGFDGELAYYRQNPAEAFAETYRSLGKRPGMGFHKLLNSEAQMKEYFPESRRVVSDLVNLGITKRRTQR